MNRLTLSGGLRYDYFGSSFPETMVGPGEFAPNRNLVLAAADGVRWHDILPRSGLALDVFGDGKTALKLSLNKYLVVYGIPSATVSDAGVFTANMAPVSLLVTSTNRSWNDGNRNFVPDCDLLNPLGGLRDRPAI